ncbi:MAG: DUF3426 domain-containing protein [Gammaproteobacteria bacterium]
MATLRHDRPERVIGSEDVPESTEDNIYDDAITEASSAVFGLTSPPPAAEVATIEAAESESSVLEPSPDEELSVTEAPPEYRSEFDSFEPVAKEAEENAALSADEVDDEPAEYPPFVSGPASSITGPDSTEEVAWELPVQVSRTSEEEGAGGQETRDYSPFDDSPAEALETETASTAPLSEPDEPSVDEAEIPSLFELPQGPSFRRRLTYRRLWGAALTLALLALAGQIVYAQRASLAGLFGVRFGHTIALDRYTIADAALDAVSRQPGVLVLSGNLVNRADHKQPLPMLRVTLTDRYGETIGARMLTPPQYGADTNAALKAHRRFMFHVKLADPGSGAVGFSLVLCKHRDRSLWCQGS